ncbi:MAG: DUF354 domain-containing protein [Candidatus Methanoperedens sp.]|nr:DUF354 domain-containing protein [Candidatus Methanoperedens sp.]
MVGVGHPKHVHIWKNVIKNLIKDGHEVKIVAREKDITLNLLDAYGFDYEVVGKNYKGMIKKIYGIFETDFKLYKIVKKFNPDLLLYGTPYLAQVSKLFNKPHIMLLDTEHANLAYWLSYPFTDVVLTPACFNKHIDTKKQVTFDGYFELAYLHPNYFKPDPDVLKEIGLCNNDKFIIMRFSAWNAHHDIKDRGFSDKIKAVKSLEKFTNVFISSEGELPDELKKYRLTLPPKKIHHLLYYADLFIGESAPMCTESAILGTPAIFVSTSRRGYTDELESKYDMVYNFHNSYDAQENAIDKAIEILQDNDAKDKWIKKKEILINEKIDVTKFLVTFIENYKL